MTRNAFTSIRDTFSDIAKRKGDAARARREGTPEGVEHSSEVYSASCARIATAFADRGFRYAKSGPHLTRKENGFTYTISFQTSYHNIPGQHVALSVAANVRSKKIKEWRVKQPRSRRKDDWVAGGLIHLLGTDLTYVSWDLAGRESREATLTDVISFIESVALPYFESFKVPGSLVAHFEHHDFPAMDIGDQVEFALCFAGRDKAETILNRFITERADLAEDIQKAEERIRTEGHISHFLTRYDELVAFLRSAYQLTGGAQPDGAGNGEHPAPQ